MPRINWQVYVGAALVAGSVLLYLLQYAIFRDPPHLFIFFFSKLAFLPLEVLFVTLIIHRWLSHREKRSLLHKLNMVIGAFFSEIGTELLARFTVLDENPEGARRHLLVGPDWDRRDFARAARELESYDYRPALDAAALEDLREFLLGKRAFLLRLLENPNLLEHESFTDLLWAVTHLAEELAHRATVHGLPAADYAHLAGDVRRAYSRTIGAWLKYMEHLQRAYPYLFSLAARTNPFDPEASPVVK